MGSFHTFGSKPIFATMKFIVPSFGILNPLRTVSCVTACGNTKCPGGCLLSPSKTNAFKAVDVVSVPASRNSEHRLTISFSSSFLFPSGNCKSRSVSTLYNSSHLLRNKILVILGKKFNMLKRPKLNSIIR